MPPVLLGLIHDRSLCIDLIAVCVGQIEEQINIDTLETLKHAFASADVNRSGDLELEEFKQLLKKQLHLSPSKVSAGSPVP